MYTHKIVTSLRRQIINMNQLNVLILGRNYHILLDVAILSNLAQINIDINSWIFSPQLHLLATQETKIKGGKLPSIIILFIPYSLNLLTYKIRSKQSSSIHCLPNTWSTMSPTEKTTCSRWCGLPTTVGWTRGPLVSS